MESNTPYAPDCSFREDYADSPPSPEGSATVCESGALCSSGWVKLHRRLLDHPKSSDSEYMWLWIYLLLNANYIKGKFSPTKYQTVVVDRGQFITSIDKLSKATRIHREKIRRLLSCMKTDKQIGIQTCSNYQTITIINYEIYQQTDIQNNKQVTNERQTSDNNIRSKEEKEDIYTTNPKSKKIEDPKINIDGTDFVKMTQKQIDKLKENLGKERAIEMIIRLDGYIGQIGEKKASKLYNSHYHTVINWHRKDISEGKYPK